MLPVPPRRRAARPVPEAPLEALAADAERLAKGWLIAAIEELPLAEAPVTAEWVADAPGVCAAMARALGSDEELARLAPAKGPLGPLRAVLWSALRAAWTDAGADQVWDLGERLAVVLETLRSASSGPEWPGALDDAVAGARAAGEELSVVLAELVDYDRLLAIESPGDCAGVISSFRDAIRAAVARRGRVVEDGEARVWVIVEGVGRDQAVGLGERIAGAVREAPPWRGAPIVAATGIAVLGEDGEDARALMEAAEESMFGSAAGART